MRKAHVVAAVIRKSGRVLIAQRHAQAERGNQWEFPGGKVEAGEEERSALVREIREELVCEVEVGKLLYRHHHRYSDLEVELAFYACSLIPGAEPRCLGAAAMEWASEEDLAQYEFCDADRPILLMLIRNG